ncbi:MAG: radical SAM protein [Clostridium sp.]|nr:radical SAM protein [Clostridium sp.]
MIGKAAYMPWWFFKSRVLKKKTPLQTVLFVTDYCDLKCRHCTPSGHGCSSMKPYEEIREELIRCYRMGSRFVDFEGGEPTLWRDGSKSLNDLYRLAKEIGFFSCTLTTNGQRPFGDTLADSVWVSVDGYEKYHDMIRGGGTFQRLDRNIRSSGHKAVSISMAVNRLNRPSLADTVRYARDNPAVRSIALNLHTPFPGTESLAMDWEERSGVLDELISLKKEGYPIMNTLSGLKVMKQKGFPKDCWIANYILADGKELPQCPGKPAGVCDDCGFCMSGEMYSVLRLKPDTLMAGLKLRLGS